MAIIYKYAIKPVMKLDLPNCVGRFLEVAGRPDGGVYMWWLFEDKSAPKIEHYFFSVPTGKEFCFKTNEAVFLGTFFRDELVFHLFEARYDWVLKRVAFSLGEADG